MNTIDFGPFRLDVAERVLLRGETAVPLKPKEMDLLCAFLANPGRLISKDEILSIVWPNVVVEESNLAVHISALRRALGDNPSAPIYIETVPRSGYRFRAELREAAREHAADLQASRSNQFPSRFRSKKFSFGFLLLAAGAAAVSWMLVSPRANAPWKVTPLTASPGLELGPALSPDGTQVIYSVRARTPAGRLDPAQNGLWRKNLASGLTERLTAALDYNPVWSPDGKEIAFIRFVTNAADADEATLVLRSTFGGGDRVIRSLEYEAGLPGPGVQYSGDGKWILTSLGAGPVFGSHPSQLVAISIATGETRPLLDAPAGFSGDINPALSPDGRRLIFCRCSTANSCNLYSVPVSNLRPTAAPEQITQTPSAAFRPIFLPDGTVLSPLGPTDAHQLWHTSWDWLGRAHSKQLSPSAEDAVQPTVATLPDGRWRLVYVRNLIDVNLIRVVLDGIDGRPTAAAPFAVSNRIEETPAYSPDGTEVAFSSNRSGDWEIWSCTVNDQHCRQLTHLAPAHSRVPAWSPDGKWIAFDSRTTGQSQVFVIPLSGGTPRAVTTTTSSNMDPIWSPDGKWLYFAGNVTGRFEIYRLASPVSSTPPAPIQITKEGGMSPRLSPDGATLFYSRQDQTRHRLNLTSNQTLQLPEHSTMLGLAPASSDLVYAFRVVGRKPYLARLDLLSNSFENLLEMRGFSRLLRVSRAPDGRQIIYSSLDRQDADLMLLDGLRP